MKNQTDLPAESLNIYKRLFPFIRPYRVRLIIGIICGVLHGVTSFGLLVALYWALGCISGDDMSLSRLPDLGQQQGTTGEVGMSRVIRTVIILPVVTVIQGVLFFAGKYLVEWVGHRMIADLRAKLFDHIHALPIQFVSQNRVGDLISRMTSDVSLLVFLVINVIGEVIREPFTLLGCIAAMIYLDWKLTVLALVVFPVCIVPVALLARRVRKASKGGQECQGDMLSVVQESIGAALVVKAFQTEQAESERFRAFNTGVFKFYMRQTRADSLSGPVVIFVSSIGLAGVVLYAFVNDLTLALLFSFGAAMIQMYKPAKKLGQVHMRIQRAVPGVERIFEILDITNTITDAPGAVPFSGRVDSVDFKDVSFAYGAKKILDGINLRSRAGQCIALVGSSGAGKTTLVNLIPRFFDVTGGRIEINGKDIRSYTVQSLRSQIGVVTQETMLFNRTVAENIAYGSPDAAREAIESAARRANAHDFIMQLENGYETVIGERGSLLSGGMAQRVAIARALLKNPPILILDEATSALDTESERLVQGALDELMKDRTVFVIAHRLSTIAHADQIVVLDQGKIVERGTHDELLAHGGKYKYLYDIQFAD